MRLLTKLTTVDDVIDYYAAEAERIHRDGTAGDHTWSGLLTDFLMAVDEVQP